MECGSIDRLSPLSLSNRIVLKNRVVVPPMASGTADGDGYATEDTVKHYERLGSSGAGLILVEYTYVHRFGRSEDHQLGIDNDKKIFGLSRIASVIKRSGALAGIQLTHAGAKTTRDQTGGVLQGPSFVAVPVRDRQLERPDSMTLAEVVDWKNSFLASAERAVQAGFDLIELHAAHGYGLNQWLSPITNQRSDLFGGEISNRNRLLVEIVTEIRKRFPDLLISVRMPGQDFAPGGITQEDGIQIAKDLERVGVNILNVSSGIGGWRRPDIRKEEGYLTQESKLIQSHVSVPVIGVGGIQTGEFIDHALRSRTFSLAAVGRAILANPSSWGAENLNIGFKTPAISRFH